MRLTSNFNRFSSAILLIAKVSFFTVSAFIPACGVSKTCNILTSAVTTRHIHTLPHICRGGVSNFNNHQRYNINIARIASASMSLSARKKKEEFPPVPHVSEDFIPEWMNVERTKVLTTPDVITPKESKNEKEKDQSCIYYWMQRDMRTADNWALLFAEHLAKEKNVPMRVVYVLPPPMPSASDSDDGLDVPPKVCEMKMTERHGSFLIGGLKIVEEELSDKSVQLEVLMPSAHDEVGQCVHDAITKENASVVVCDMSPLRQYRDWMENQATPLLIDSGIPLYQVDAHNVVPVWHASPKREVGARTLRPKINKLLGDFLTHFPEFEGNTHIPKNDSLCKASISWDDCVNHLDWDTSVKSVEWAKPGGKFAAERFEEFTTSTTEGLKNFDTLRNDPNYSKVCSNLSPWVNYGHVSFQRLALDVRALKRYPNGTASYIEEGIVRRELSDNFVYYSQENYDDLSTAAQWAQDSLELHSTDEREYIYSLDQFQTAATHDNLWNAAQIQLNSTGKMHGFLRMYWAKKILEWTESPAQALRIGLYLNDRFALDGNDPNGFTGVGWSIMGIHDMGWKERSVFGKIRFMNYNGCKRKFKVDEFVSKYVGGSRIHTTTSQVKSIAKGTKRKASSVNSAKEKKSTTEKIKPGSSQRTKYETMTVAQLKDGLRKRGLQVSGKKADLIKRLRLSTR